MKLLWHSVSPWSPTGYGQQTGVTVPRLKALGHDIAISCYYGLQGAEMDWRGVRCYPSYSAAYGSDVIVPHAMHHFGAEQAGSLEEASTMGLIVTLGDVWTFESPLLDQLSVASWVPIDHLQVPDVVNNWFRIMGSIPIAMSRFGEQALQLAGFHPQYVPHGIDTTMFCPGDQAEAREAVGIPPDAFVVAIVANNVGRDGNRKAFSEQIAAFAEFHEKHNDAMLVLHCDTDQPAGMRLRPFLQRTLPEGSYTYTDIYAYRKGLNPSAVAEIYRAADVLSNTSYGEGFGIPIIEAQACGTPVVVTDATAMPELCGAGWKVGYQKMWHDSQGAWAAVPKISEIVDAYEEAYNHARDPDLKLMAWGFAQDYDADRVVENYWVPTLERFEQALEDRRRDVATQIRRPARVPEKVRESDGYLWLDRGDRADDWVAYTDHENWIRPHLDDLLPDGGVMLDVGAHVGRWAIRMAAKASMVIAVEANPATAKTLRRHLAMNDIHNVVVVEMAAWDEPARLLLEDPNQRLDGGGTRTIPSRNGDDGTVRAGRLDEELIDWFGDDLRRLDLVKVDVEGADLHALRGMEALLRMYRPALLIECHDIYGYYQRAELEQTLTDLGYSFEVAASVPSNWQPGVGIISEVRDADYLVCQPIKATV